MSKERRRELARREAAKEYDYRDSFREQEIRNLRIEKERLQLQVDIGATAERLLEERLKTAQKERDDALLALETAREAVKLSVFTEPPSTEGQTPATCESDGAFTE